MPLSFGNDEEALRAVGSGVVVIDRSHGGRIRLTGDDRLAFLHGQSTADITSLEPGQGTDTVNHPVRGQDLQGRRGSNLGLGLQLCTLLFVCCM